MCTTVRTGIFKRSAFKSLVTVPNLRLVTRLNYQKLIMNDLIMTFATKKGQIIEFLGMALRDFKMYYKLPN